MSDKKLKNILDDLINGRLANGQLSGGLALQYKTADSDHPENRLCAIRVGVPVGATELVTLRRELENILPGVEISLDDQQEIAGRDNTVRFYRVFRWAKNNGPKQLGLF